jgi:hypothetical protein
MVLCEACGSLVTKVDREKNESNPDRCWLCVKMDLFRAEEKANGSSVPKEITAEMTKEEAAYIKKRNKKAKVCDVSEEHVRRRTQWTTLKGNRWRSLAWTDESSEEDESEESEEGGEEVDEEVVAMKAERKRKKAERKAEQKAEKNAAQQEEQAEQAEQNEPQVNNASA